jgi:hypothetical protein
VALGVLLLEVLLELPEVAGLLDEAHPDQEAARARRNIKVNLLRIQNLLLSPNKI